MLLVCLLLQLEDSSVVWTLGGFVGRGHRDGVEQTCPLRKELSIADSLRIIETTYSLLYIIVDEKAISKETESTSEKS